MHSTQVGWICICRQKRAIKEILSVPFLFCKVNFNFPLIFEAEMRVGGYKNDVRVIKADQVRATKSLNQVAVEGEEQIYWKAF